MSDEKSFSVCEEMLPLFRAVLKFCSTNRLFTIPFLNYCNYILFLFFNFAERMYMLKYYLKLEKKLKNWGEPGLVVFTHAKAKLC